MDGFLHPQQDDEPRGVTYLWNQAYRLFKASPQYQALFIVNNDIIFPNGTFTLMAQVGLGRGVRGEG